MSLPAEWDNPTWKEGYDARRVGWGLHKGASPAYARGWTYRERLENPPPGPRPTVYVFKEEPK